MIGKMIDIIAGSSGGDPQPQPQPPQPEPQPPQPQPQPEPQPPQPEFKPYVPIEHPNNLLSDSTLQIIDLIGEGEIYGLKNGLKSVFINNTPIENTDGTKNFVISSHIQRTGTQIQSYVDGFDDVRNEVVVDLPVKQAIGPVVKTISDTTVDEVWVRIALPSLQQQLDNGDIVGTDVSLRIERQYAGAAYQVVINDTISGKTNALYEKSYVVPLKGAFPVNIRVSRLTADSQSNRVANAFNWSSYVEVTNAKLAYPNSALQAFRLLSSQLSSIPSRSYLIRGIKVKLPNNAIVDQTNGRVTYNGVWTGTFGAAQWCADPAWCLWDLLTNSRYGFGRFLDSNKLDRYSFYAASQYCNELVPNGRGGTEPRFQLNINIDTTAEAYTAINDLLSVFRCMGYWAAGELQLVQDAPTIISYVFTGANVVEGKFTYRGASLKVRSTLVIVQWYDMEQRQTAYEYVADQEGIIKYGVITKEIKAIGTTSQSQAHRLGKWMLYTDQFESETVEFDVGAEAGVIVRPGMVIGISDSVRTGTRHGGRIIAATTTLITVDSFKQIVGDNSTLSIILPDGSVEERKVLAGNEATKTYTTEAFSTVPATNALWIYQSSAVQTQLFRVVGIKENAQDQSTYTINALSYNLGKYDAVEKDIKLTPRPISQIQQIPNSVSNITVTENLYLERQTVKVQVNIGWKHAERAVRYAIKYRIDNNNWINLPQQPQSAVSIRDTQPGLYEIQITSISILNKVSPTASIIKQIFGLAIPPADVIGFNATVIVTGKQIGRAHV